MRIAGPPPRTRQDARVEFTKRHRLLVLHLCVGHLAVPKRVVHGDEASNAHLKGASGQAQQNGSSMHAARGALKRTSCMARSK